MNDNSAAQSTIVFTSLTLILLTFFLFLSSLAIADAKKQKAALESLSTKFVAASVDRAQQEPSPPGIIIARELAGMSFAQRVGQLHSLADAGGMRIQESDESLRVILPAGALFMPPSDQLRAQFIPALTKIADQAKRYALGIEIECHTDAGGSPLEELELTALHAASVYRFFLDAGLPPSALSAKGVGSYQPQRSNDSDAGRSANRRVELVLRSLPAAE